MLLLQLLQTLQHDHHDVIVILGVEKVGVRHGRGTDRRGRIGKRNERPRGLVRHGGRIRRQHLEQDADEAGLLIGIASAGLAGQVQDEEGESIPELDHVVQVFGKELDGQFLRFVVKHEEGIPARPHVDFGIDEGIHELGSIGDESFPMQSMGMKDGQYGILTDILMTMLQTGLNTWNERSQNFLILDCTQETKHRSPNVLIGVVQIIHERIAHQNHLGQ
mmetsp:Transcript_6869/g.15686  ORF Transcript_6869/g.15686 Transcript_6869/m.15686 type:complete len:220 (+) Transcript_6869:2053-2712(+)